MGCNPELRDHVRFTRFGRCLFDNIPDIETNIINKEGLPYLGVGEVVAGPTGAAISNAIYEALGQRIKTMPFTKENIKKELLN